MRVLITGADGFVGRHACDVFRAAGYEVFEVRGPSDRASAHPEVWHLNILDASALRKAIEDSRPDAVLHLAGASSVARSHSAPRDAFEVNTLGTVNVLESVRAAAPAARVLIIGSGEVYGPVPAEERAAETWPLVPTSPYAASKLAAEIATRQFHRSYGVQAICARPFNHLGSGQAAHFMVPSFASQIESIRYGITSPRMLVGNLEPVRDFSHVRDVVDAYRLLLLHGVPGDSYNVCGGEGRSIRSILDELLQLAAIDVTPTPNPALLRPAEIPSLVGDPSKLRALGWSPSRTVRDALTEALADASARVKLDAHKSPLA